MNAATAQATSQATARAAVWPTPIERESFTEAMSHWASGVTVVTTLDSEHNRHGFTANSFTAVSLNPPLVLVCLGRNANCMSAFDSATWLAIHILGRDQEAVAASFASRGADKFAGLRIRPGLAAVPVLCGAVATMECRITERVPAGDHLILIAEVYRTDSAGGDPLLYHRRAFRGVR
jgi:flavin reductase ActVB